MDIFGRASGKRPTFVSSDPGPASRLERSRLESWKEIAAYFRRTVRTVRRWEGEGLPVHRHLHKRLGSVYFALRAVWACGGYDASAARVRRETDQRYKRTRSRYAFVPESPRFLRDVDTREQESSCPCCASPRARVDDRH